MYSNKELRQKRKFQWHNGYTISEGVEKRLGKECKQRKIPDEYLYPTKELPLWIAISSTGKQIAKLLEQHSRLEGLIMPVSEPLNKGDLVITKHNINGYVLYCSSRISSDAKKLDKAEGETPFSLHTRIFIESEYEHELAIMNKYMDNSSVNIIEYDKYEDFVDNLTKNLKDSTVIIEIEKE